MKKSNIFDPNCPSCAKGIEVYYATQNQEYTYESGIYGFYTLQPSEKIVNGRAYFKKGKFGIWWDGQDKTFYNLTLKYTFPVTSFFEI